MLSDTDLVYVRINFSLKNQIGKIAGMTQEEKMDVYRDWKPLINMSVTEILNFATSPEGKSAGLSRKAAAEKGIKSGRESALALIRMIPKGRGMITALEYWTPSDWRWAKRQISFIRRMLGMRKRITGNPFYKEGKMTRWLAALMIWGHDPRKTQ